MAGINPGGGAAVTDGGKRFTGSMEKNNHLKGKGQSAGPFTSNGPAKGRASGNSTSGGGINRATKGTNQRDTR